MIPDLYLAYAQLVGYPYSFSFLIPILIGGHPLPQADLPVLQELQRETNMIKFFYFEL